MIKNLKIQFPISLKINNQNHAATFSLVDGEIRLEVETPIGMDFSSPAKPALAPAKPNPAPAKPDPVKPASAPLAKVIENVKIPLSPPAQASKEAPAVTELSEFTLDNSSEENQPAQKAGPRRGRPPKAKPEGEPAPKPAQDFSNIDLNAPRKRGRPSKAEVEARRRAMDAMLASGQKAPEVTPAPAVSSDLDADSQDDEDSTEPSPGVSVTAVVKGGDPAPYDAVENPSPAYDSDEDETDEASLRRTPKAYGSSTKAAHITVNDPYGIAVDISQYQTPAMAITAMVDNAIQIGMIDVQQVTKAICDIICSHPTGRGLRPEAVKNAAQMIVARKMNAR